MLCTCLSSDGDECSVHDLTKTLTAEHSDTPLFCLPLQPRRPYAGWLMKPSVKLSRLRRTWPPRIETREADISRAAYSRGLNPMCRSSPCLQFPRKMKKNGSSMMAADLWINRAMAARQREVGSGWMSELTSRRLMLMPVVDVAAAAAAARRVDAIGRDGGSRLLLGVMGEVSWGRGGWLRRLLGPSSSIN